MLCIVTLAHLIKTLQNFVSYKTRSLQAHLALYVQKLCGRITCQACIYKFRAKSKLCLNIVDVLNLCFRIELCFCKWQSNTLCAKREIYDPSAPYYHWHQLPRNTLHSSGGAQTLMLNLAMWLLVDNIKLSGWWIGASILNSQAVGSLLKASKFTAFLMLCNW